MIYDSLCLFVHQPPIKEGEEGEEGVAVEAEEDVVYTYIPPEAKAWVSQGSEKEIKEEDVSETRRRVRSYSYHRAQK